VVHGWYHAPWDNAIAGGLYTLNSGSADGVTAVGSLACVPAFTLGAAEACAESRRVVSLGVDMGQAVKQWSGTRHARLSRPGPSMLLASSH
jgi:hypothetical protein